MAVSGLREADLAASGFARDTEKVQAQEHARSFPRKFELRSASGLSCPSTMNLLTYLSESPREFRGAGRNHEQQRFVGILRVEPLTGGSGVLLRYRAVVDDVGEVHSEVTLLGRGPDQKLCLWPAMSELPLILPHKCIRAEPTDDGGLEAVFASGLTDEVENFREEITIRVHPGGRLVYAHARGMPDGEFAARSTCEMRSTEI